MEIDRDGRIGERYRDRVDFDRWPQSRFVDRVRHGDYDRLYRSRFADRIQLREQYLRRPYGDVARSLRFHDYIRRVGWHGGYQGRVGPNFVNLHFSSWYLGPGFYPRYAWTPRWSPWVSWSWWDTCPVWFDPRPVFSRPILYPAAPAMTVFYEYPAWQPLYEVSGTWVDVEPVTTPQTDLELLAVRFVDSGHPEEQLGPRYRVWFRSNGADAVPADFNVMLLAGMSAEPREDLLQSGVRVRAEDLEPGLIRSVDIRLPFETAALARDAQGNPMPFSHLHILVDSHRELEDMNPQNNGAVVPREEVLPVDPALFAPQSTAVGAGDLVTIAGEGLGPEPGQVIVSIDGTELQPVIEGWYDLGVRFEMPRLPLGGDVEVSVIVVRRDGAATNPVPLVLAD